MKRIVYLILALGLTSRTPAQSPPVFTLQPAGQLAETGATVTFTAGASGTGPLGYQWLFNGTNVAFTGIITTYAGSALTGFSGDGAKSTNAALQLPVGVAVDSLGNVFIADTGNNRVRLAGTNGLISTVAGNGTPGYAGDGGLATNANLNGPAGVALDGLGNLYIADSSNNCVRKVDVTGVITTVAGTGSAGYSGDGNAATNATLNAPAGITFDSVGNLYIADSSNNCVRKIDLTGTITTVAGNAAAGYAGDGTAATAASLNSPLGVAVDGLGNLFIADSKNSRVRQVATNGIITTIAGNGTAGYTGDSAAATNANLTYPTGVAVGAAGTLFIADAGTNSVRMVDATGIITTVAGYGTPAFTGDGNAAAIGGLHTPSGVAVDGTNNLFIADTGNGRVRRVTAQGSALTLVNVNAARAGNYTAVVSSIFGSVTSSVAPLNLIAPPVVTNQISTAGPVTVSFTASGPGPVGYQWFVGGVAIPGQTNAVLSLPNAATTDTGTYVLVLTNQYGAVTSAPINLAVVIPSVTPTTPQIMAYSWSTIAGNGTNKLASFNYPSNLILDTNGNIFVTDRANSTIRKIAPSGTNWVTSTIAGSPGATGTANGTNSVARFNNPSGLVMDSNGNLFVADRLNFTIRKITPSGTNWITTTIAGTAGAEASTDGTNLTARFNEPQGPAMDSAGNLYVADYGSSAIRMISPSGTNWITTTISKTNFTSPGGVAITASGTILIDNQGGDAMATLTPSGTNWIATTIVGNVGHAGSADATNTAATFNFPGGIAVDSATNIYVADDSNNTVRQIMPSGTNWLVRTIGGSTLSASYRDGVATATFFSGPNGVAVDAAGKVYVADSGNNFIRLGQPVVPEFILAPGGITNFTELTGSSVVFAATYPGSGTTTYQWQLNGTNIASANQSTLVLTNLSANNAGEYNLVVKNPSGTNTSAFLLTLYSAPALLQSPTNMFAAVSQTATFNASASGTQPLNYQWYAGGNPLPGQTNAALVLPNVGLASAGGYQIVVTNLYGSVTSSTAVLTVGYAPAIAAQPEGLAMLPGGNPVFSVTAAGTGPFTYQWLFNGTNIPSIITTVAGNGTNGYSGDGGVATNAKLSTPYALAADNAGNLFLADYGNYVVRKIDTNGVITTYGGTGTNGYTGDGGAATNAELGYLNALATDAAGDLLLTDEFNYRIRLIATNGLISTFAGTGAAGSIGNGAAATNAELNAPTGVAVDALGNTYIADLSEARIRKVDTNGIISIFAGTGTTGYSGDGSYATNARISNPMGVTTDAAGNVYLADYGNARIRKIDTNGIITTVAGNGTNGFSGDGGYATNAKLNAPSGVAVDASGNLCIADLSNERIRFVSAASGVITTVAGSSLPGYSGDGGAPTNANLNQPRAVLLDGLGNCYVADAGNYRVRKFNLQLPTLVVNNAGFGNAGDYSVVVSSVYGSVTSSVANLRIALPPLSTGVSGGTNLTVQMSGTPGQTYILEAASGFHPPIVWQPVFTNTADANGNWSYTNLTLLELPGLMYRLTTP